MNHPRYFSLIPAAGVGARMGDALPKQYLQLGGLPMLRRTVEAFLASAVITHTFVVISEADAHAEPALPAALAGVTLLRCGGATRQESVLNGLRSMRGQVAPEDWVLVHDAARPGLTPALITKLITQTGDHPGGGMLGLPVVDTVKSSTDHGLITISRDGLWLAQTPQMFRHALLLQALELTRHLAAVTDEASALELSLLLPAGCRPKMVEGHPCNAKVTLEGDIQVAEMYLHWAKRS